MPFEIAQVLRIKGIVDAAVAQAPADPFTATPGLIQTYLRVRSLCAEMVTGTDAAAEFDRLFPVIEAANDTSVNTIETLTFSARGDSARSLLAQLGGWLGSWPSADQLLEELIHALEAAEARAEGAEKARLAGLLEGLRGAGREIAIGVVTAYLERVHL